jgi:hypothetical protein
VSGGNEALIAQQQISFIQKENQLDVMADDNLLVSYWYSQHLSKPILYPVMTPSGHQVTRDFPFKEVTGESHDHPHHTGVSFTYGSSGEVNGQSFWANPHDRTPLTSDIKLPQIRQIEVVDMKEGKGRASLKTINHWVNHHARPILAENRLMEFYARDNEYIIDFTINLSAIDTVVTFEDTKEGMFAIRVADWLAEDANGTREKSTGVFENAEGEMTEKNIWAKRSSWVRLEGERDGKGVGVTIMHHPESLNYPTYWHARGYGCFAANPIGQFDYQKGRNLDNPQHRTLVLQPGESALFKFRMVIYEGTRSKDDIDKEFAEFSEKF